MSFEIKIKDACTLSSDKTITAREALALSNFPKKEAVVACRVNREQRPLSWELVMDSYIEFITTDSIVGIEVYTRTRAFLLTAAATRVLGVRLHLTQSMLYSYFYESPERELSEEDCAALRGIKHHGVLRPVIDLDLRYAGHIAQIVFQYVRLMQRHPGALHVHPQTPGGFMENCAFHGYSAVASSSEVSSTTAAASSSARCSLMALASE